MSDKYGRSFHLPWSPGGTCDDKRMSSIDELIGVEIVITEKMDGGNACLTRDNVWARSHSTTAKEYWWSMVKALHASVKSGIDENLSIFGENVWPVHSIVYTEDLPGSFLMFNVREDDTQTWWSWDDVMIASEALDIPTVPILFRGVVNSEEELRDLTTRLASIPSVYGPEREGLVVRVARAFTTDEFSKCLAKHVRADHVQTNKHWTSNVVPQPCFRQV